MTKASFWFKIYEYALRFDKFRRKIKMSLKNVTTPETNVAVLEIEIGAAEFSEAVTRSYNSKKGNIQLPGFRKGHAPRNLIEKMYGKGFFFEDALEELVPAAYEEALEKSGVKAVSAPEYDVTSASEEEGVVLTAKVYTKPEVSIEGYKGIEVTRSVEEVTDEQIDAEIDRVRNRNSRTTDVEGRAAQTGDTANINYEGFKDGVPFDGGKGEDYDLKLGSGTFIPGFEDAIVGHEIGEDFDVNVTFPEDYHAEELAGAAVVFKTHINVLKETILPELDDEFVKDVSEFDTVEQYKADIKAKLEKTAADRADGEVTDQVVTALTEKLVAEIPEVMFVNETENQVRDFDNRLRMQGLKLSDYMKYLGTDLDGIRAQMRPKAEVAVKLNLALEKIAELEAIEISDEAIEDELKRLSDTYSMELARVKELVDPADVRLDLAKDKALQLCKEAAVVKE